MWKTLILLSVLLACLGAKLCLRHRDALKQRFEEWKLRFKDWKQRFDNWNLHRKRPYDDWKRHRQFRREWHPTILDGSSLSKKIERVRQDPVGVLHSRSRRGALRSALTASVRHSILRLPYFRKLTKERPACDDPEPDNHAA